MPKETPETPDYSQNPYIPPYRTADTSAKIEYNMIKYILAFLLVYQFGFLSSVFICIGALALACFFATKE